MSQTTMIAMLEEAEDVLRRAGCDMTADRVRGVLQAQQAEEVGDGESIDFPIAFLTTESGCGKYKLVLSFASLPDLHKGHDRILSAIKHCQPPAQQQAEPVAREPDFYVVTGGYNHMHEWCDGQQWIADKDDIKRLGSQFSYVGGYYAAQQHAEPVALSLPFFVYDSETGFERFATEVEAKAAAQESIEAYREDAGEGWAEEVENICWGVVLGATREVALPDEYSGGNGLADSMKPVDYVLTDAAQPPAVAVLQAELDEWRKLRDPKVLHVNLCRGFPAKLTAEQLLHIAGDEKQQQAVAVPDGVLSTMRRASQALDASSCHKMAAQLREARHLLDTLAAAQQGAAEGCGACGDDCKGQGCRLERESPPTCQTCNGQGMIGGLLPNGGGSYAEPCPDCTAPKPTAEDSSAVPGNAAQDAARYRLLRLGRCWSVIDGLGAGLQGEELDAAVDVALGSAAQKGGDA